MFRVVSTTIVFGREKNTTIRLGREITVVRMGKTLRDIIEETAGAKWRATDL